MRFILFLIFFLPFVVFSQSLTEKITKLQQEIELVGDKNFVEFVKKYVP